MKFNTNEYKYTPLVLKPNAHIYVEKYNFVAAFVEDTSRFLVIGKLSMHCNIVHVIFPKNKCYRGGYNEEYFV